VILKILKILSGIEAPWLEFNEENTHLLTHAKVDWARWLRGFERFEREIHFGRHPGILGVYSCPSGSFTQDAYVRLTQQHRMSVISPHAIGFLGASQLVQPMLLFARRNHWQKFDCSYLDRDQTLHAYGPLAQDILEIPGAPAARVAACLGYWGIALEPHSLMRITQPLVKDQTLIVAQNPLLKDSHELSRQLIELIPDATEVVVKTT
jgi:hypothetical protein